MKGIDKKNGNNKRIKSFIALVVVFVSAYNIPKFMEYHLKLQTTRTDYDANDYIWSKIATETWSGKALSLKEYSQLEFKENNPEITELGAEPGKY